MSKRRFYIARDFWSTLSDKGEHDYAVYDREQPPRDGTEWPIATFALRRHAVVFRDALNRSRKP